MVMASSGNGDTGGSYSGGWRDRQQGGGGENRDGDFGGGSRGRGFRGYRNGGGGDDHGEYPDSSGGGFRGYRGGRGGRFNRGRGFSSGNRRPNGLNPRASRFDDDLAPPPPKLDMTPVGNEAKTNVFWEACEKNRLALKEKEKPFVFEPPETDFHLEAAGLLREVS